MKKTYTSVLIVAGILFTGQLFAQNRAAVREKIEAAKIAFFTHQLQLTPNEAKLFWPEYELYQKHIETQKEARAKTLKGIDKRIEDMSDKEINTLIDSRLNQAQSVLEARTEFVGAMRKILPPAKVVRYFKAEDLFKKKLLERLDERKNTDRSMRKRP
jgi:hypothetical protein